MDFSVYLGRFVKIDVSSGYYYCGRVVSADDTFLSLIDKNSKNVTVSTKDILNIREIDR